MQAITGALRARVRLAAGVLLAAALALGVLRAGSAAAATAYSAASAEPRPIPSTGWNGRPIERPHKPVDEAVVRGAKYPAGWSAGAVRFGAGYHKVGGSDRVREVQRRLMRLGYHTGPIDGLYGPLTRSAVQWFQIKHGLRPTGVVAAATLAVLRRPKMTWQRPEAKVARVPASRQPGVSPGARPERAPLEPTRERDGGTRAWELPVLLALVAALLVVSALTLIRAAGRSRADKAPRPEPVRAALPPAAPSREHVPVLGYVSTDSPDAGAVHEAAIRDACQARGWTLARLVHDSRPGKGRGLGRPGLAYALEQLSEGAASRLVVHRLDHLARSMNELRMVLGWFLRMGVAVTALDVNLDTGTREGKMAVRALLAVTRSEEARRAARTRSGLAAARAARPAVEDRPELAGRIREMRASGMTLQAIADTLNEEGVPTTRGGAMWRPSSVQSVLGYKRSRARTGGW